MENTENTNQTVQEPVQNPQPVQPQTVAPQAAPAKKGMSTGVKVLLGCLGCGVIAVIIIGVLISLGGYGLKKAVDKVGTEIEKSEQAESDNFKNPKKVSDTVKTGDVQWKVLEAKDLGSTIKATSENGEDCTAETGNKFVMVKINAKNTGSETATLLGAELFDAEKTSFNDYGNVLNCSSDGESANLYLADTLESGAEKTYLAYFEVPTAAKDLRLKVGDTVFIKSNIDYISLGL